jgi:sugar O-acyltransferase (sialic acid O-acetyltransferase NeuD family)
MKKIVLWGATGQSIVLDEFLHKLGYRIIALFENNKNIKSPFADIPIFIGKEGFYYWKSKNKCTEIFFLVAIGGDKGRERLEIQDFFISEGLKPTSACHPHSYIADSVKIGIGCQILVNSTVCAKVIIEDGVIVNTSASIDHECIIRKGVHIGPGAKLAGCVEVGENSFIGTGAIILPRIKIGKNVIVGAGAVVTKNVSDNLLVYGNPAKIIKIIKKNQHE